MMARKVRPAVTFEATHEKGLLGAGNALYLVWRWLHRGAYVWTSGGMLKSSGISWVTGFKCN